MLQAARLVGLRHEDWNNRTRGLEKSADFGIVAPVGSILKLFRQRDKAKIEIAR
jgi:hypothetical protein